jgi:endonuclease-8
MRHGVSTGRIDTVRPEHMPDVTGRQPRQDRHGGEVYVYRRAGQPCHVCGAEIAVAGLQGRKLYWCPRCQAG